MRQEFPPPRDFQILMKDLARGHIKKGIRRLVLSAPTGSGKTYIALDLIRAAIARGHRSLFAADRIAIVDQTASACDRWGIEHGVVMAGRKPRPSAALQIASIHTLAKRPREKWPQDFKLLFYDECHTQYDVMRNLLAALPPDVIAIGLSATPFAKGLAESYDALVSCVTMDELTRSGILKKIRVIHAKPIDLISTSSKGAEWKKKDVSDRVIKIAGDIVSTWQTHAENRQTIVFAGDIGDCQRLEREFNQAGVVAACYTSLTDELDREAYLRRFDAGQIRVLITVEALAKGFDRPYVSCIVDARPLRKSLSTFIQMIGRGLRCFEGQTDCLLIDHSGNIVRFIKDFTDFYFNGVRSLTAGEKLDKVARKDEVNEKGERTEGKACFKCGYKPCGKRCISCGAVQPMRSRVVVGDAEIVEGLAPQYSPLTDPTQLYAQLHAYAVQTRPDIADWRAKNLFQSISKAPMPNNVFPIRPEPAPVSPEVLRAIRASNIRYAKSKKKAAK